MLQQKVKLLSQTDSLNMVKNVVRLGISVITYLRDLFDEQAYDDVVFQGMTLKMLKRVDAKSDMLLNWLDRGIFDAIEKQYLQMLIFDINDIKDNTIECYKFTFNYNREDGTGDIDFAVESTAKHCNTNSQKIMGRNEKNGMHMYDKEKTISNAQRLNDIRNRLLGVQRIPPNHNTSHAVPSDKPLPLNGILPGGDKKNIDKIKRHHRDETTKKAKRLLETLVSLTADLGPLPEQTYLSMKLLYYDEYTPEDYQPELFRDPQEQDLIAFQKKPDSLAVGDLGTDYHALSVSISTTCLPTRSWTIEELYEQLILTERKETIKKSLSLIEDLVVDDLAVAADKHLLKNKLQSTEKEQFMRNETHLQENALDFHNLKGTTHIQEQNTHSTHTQQIFSNYENQSMNEIPKRATFMFDNTQPEGEPSLSINAETKTQRQQILITNKIENEQNYYGSESQKVKVPVNNTSEEQLVSLQREEKPKKDESDKTKNPSTPMEQENKQVDEEHIKKYILTSKVTSRQQLKKMYRHVSNATLSKILSDLIKEGILRQYKHSVYRLCAHATEISQNRKERNAFNKGRNKKEDNTEGNKENESNKYYGKNRNCTKAKKKKDNSKINESKENNGRKKKLELKHTIKNITKLAQSNNKNDVQHVFVDGCKHITSNDVSQSILHMTQSNVLSSTARTHKVDTQSTLFPLLSSNETKTHRLHMERSTYKSNANSAHMKNKGENSANKNCQDRNNDADAHCKLANLINENTDPKMNTHRESNDISNSNNIDNTIKTKKKKKKHETRQDGKNCAKVHSKKKDAKEKKTENTDKLKKSKKMKKKENNKRNEIIIENETSERNETKERNDVEEKNKKLEICNSNSSNQHLIYTEKSVDGDYSKAFSEIEKLYNDLCQSCKSTKYINKEIISKGLGIEPRLTRPLLERLMKDGYVSKKVVKNKGYESFLYEPLHLTYKRKLQETNISDDANICPLKKKIHA